MSLKHGILGFLSYGSQTGYDLDKAFRASVDFFWHATTSQIYRELGALETDGMVESRIIVQTERPSKKLYEITPKGRETFLAWLAAYQPDQALYFRSSFLVKLFFSGERPMADSVAQLKQFRQDCSEGLKAAQVWNESINEYKSQVRTADDSVYWMLTRNFGFDFLSTCVRWADHCIETLEAIIQEKEKSDESIGH